MHGLPDHVVHFSDQAGPVTVSFGVAGLAGQAGVLAERGVEDRDGLTCEIVRSKNSGLCRAWRVATVRSSRRRSAVACGSAASSAAYTSAALGPLFGNLPSAVPYRWVFGDRQSGGHLKFAWTSIDRHVMVKGGASPDDPALTDYWAGRRQRSKPPLDNYTLGLLTRQDGRCPLCGEHLLTTDQPPQSPQQWERWWLQGHPQGDSRQLPRPPRATW